MDNCTRCNRIFKNDAMDMGDGNVWCPRCYIDYRLYCAKQQGIELDLNDRTAIWEGRKHIEDVLKSRGMK